jgi:hypothetical protein
MKISKELESFILTSIWWNTEQGRPPNSRGFEISVTAEHLAEVKKWQEVSQIEQGYRNPASAYYKADVGNYNGVFPAGRDGEFSYWFTFDAIKLPNSGIKIRVTGRRIL